MRRALRMGNFDAVGPSQVTLQQDVFDYRVNRSKLFRVFSSVKSIGAFWEARGFYEERRGTDSEREILRKMSTTQ